MSDEISIEGLDAKQRMLADIIWSLNTKAQVEAFIRTLPLEMARDARNIVNLMIIASIEQSVGADSPMDEAEEILKRIAKKT